jgi:hypothetical protein
MSSRYYTTQGFVSVSDFLCKEADREWAGMLMRMDLE